MRYSAIMFDLDGTLADTLADIATAANAVLIALGRPTHDVAAYRRFVGHGARWLFEQALGETHHDLAARAKTMLESHFAEHGHPLTQPYAGVTDMLDALSERGVVMTVLSNKPDAAAKHTVDAQFGRWTFAKVLGHREDLPLKPDPASARLICDELNIAASQWLYLGDSEVDMQTAKAASMFAVGATWGFRDRDELLAAGADRLIDHPSQLLDLLD
jgi:phosphoglycolate phosphatase